MQLNWIQNKKVPRQNNMHKAKKYITALAVVTIVLAGVYGLYINTQINNIVLSLILSILNYFSILTSKRKNIKFFLIFLLYLYKDMY